MTTAFAQYVGLIGFALLLATGQILFKYAATTAPRIGSVTEAVVLAYNPYLWVAGVLYAVATVLWVVLLQHVPLSRAYIFAALGFVIVPMASAMLFGDTLPVRFLIGTGFIIVGIYLAGAAPR